VADSTKANGTPSITPKYKASMALMRMLMQHMMTPMTQNVLPFLLSRRLSAASVGKKY
jgi:hypothetical protein